MLNRYIHIILFTILLIPNNTLAQDFGQKAQDDMWRDLDGSIQIVSPSHGDISIIEKNDVKINFEVWVSTDSPIRVVEISRNKSVGKGRQRIDSKQEQEKIIILNKQYLSSTNWFSNFVFVKQQNEEKIYVRVITQKTTATKEFTIRSCCKYTSDDPQVLKLNTETSRDKRNHFFPGYFGTKNYDNITKATEQEEKFSGQSLFINQAYIGYHRTSAHDYNWKTAFSYNTFTAHHSYDPDVEDSYKLNELTIFDFSLGAKSKWSDFIEYDINAGYIASQREQSKEIETSVDETNNYLDFLFGYNLSKEKTGYIVSAGYHMLTIDSPSSSSASNADSYDISGSISTTNFHFSYDQSLKFWEIKSIEAGIDYYTSEYQAAGIYMGSQEQGMDGFVNINSEIIDVSISRTLMHEEKYNEIRKNDSAAMVNQRIQSTISAKIKISKTLRFILSLNVDNQESNQSDYSYQASTLTLAIGWTG
jgi:hypothetical protein